eukprot:1186395-Prymnesium_polylepis.1
MPSHAKTKQPKQPVKASWAAGGMFAKPAAKPSHPQQAAALLGLLSGTAANTYTTNSCPAAATILAAQLAAQKHDEAGRQRNNKRAAGTDGNVEELRPTWQRIQSPTAAVGSVFATPPAAGSRSAHPMQQRLGSSAQVCAEAAAVDAIAAAQKKRDAERARAAAAAAAEASRGEQSIPRGEQHQQPHPQAAEQAAQPQGAEAAPSSSAGRVVHSWLYPIMNKCGLEVLVAGKGDHKLQGSLAGLSKKSFVRAKVDPQPARKAPSVLPAVQDTIGPEEYHRVMAFAEEYGLMGRPRHGNLCPNLETQNQLSHTIPTPHTPVRVR